MHMGAGRGRSSKCTPTRVSVTMSLRCSWHVHTPSMAITCLVSPLAPLHTSSKLSKYVCSCLFGRGFFFERVCEREGGGWGAGWPRCVLWWPRIRVLSLLSSRVRGRHASHHTQQTFCHRAYLSLPPHHPILQTLLPSDISRTPFSCLCVCVCACVCVCVGVMVGVNITLQLPPAL